MARPQPANSWNDSELYQAYPVLTQMPRLLQETLRHNARRVHLAPGALFFDVDQACTSFVMVTRGVVRVFKPGEERDIFLYTVERGQSCILTVSCLLGDARYPARGVVEEELTGYAIPHSLFLEMVERCTAFRHFVFHLFGERLTTLMALVEEIAFLRLDQRLARLLLHRTASQGQPLLHTTHQQLAEELGSVREVVSRILKQMEIQGLVRLKRGQVMVLDRAGLERFAALEA